jgi:tRNA-uridine 2-sulfurtransferase
MAKTVFVGLSGGVDSAVSAALLLQRGFNVVGVFIKIWQPEFTACTWATDRIDAMRVAVALGIPFREIDLSEEYKWVVVEDMTSAYRRGFTPNPDVLCNRHIKFGSFKKYALKEGADYIATGHYARIEQGTRQKALGNIFELLRGKDNNKDQSYFLYTLGQDDLAITLFPVGELQKMQVRDLASKLRLPVARKPDSKGLCFVGDVTMKDFLSKYIDLQSGSVLDDKGCVVGVHDGAALYTIGQRHGFTIERTTGNMVPHYVVDIDIQANTIRVSTEHKSAARNHVSVGSMHWIGNIPEMPADAMIQTRYREKPVEATINGNSASPLIIFNAPHVAAAGQSLVAYDGDTCLGGGVMSG